MTGLFEQFSASLEQFLEQDARQRRYTMEAYETNTKTCERTEGAAIVVQAMRGDRCTTAQKVQDIPMTSITFGVEAEPPDLPCRDDVLVEGGDAAPRLCLPYLEMRSPTPAGGLVPTCKTSTTTKTNFNQSPLWFCSTEETNLEVTCDKISTPYVSYDSNSFWRLLAAPYCWRVVETKSRLNRTFDRGGLQGHLHACPFLRSWRALLRGKVIRAGAAGW